MSGKPDAVAIMGASMRKRSGRLAVLLLAAVWMAGPGVAPATSVDLNPYLPDLRTVVPHHLNLVHEHGQDVLRFTNGIANTGNGPWAMRPDPPPGSGALETTAVQQIRDNGARYQCGTQKKNAQTCFNVLAEFGAGVYEFHPEHNHWHIGEVAQFEVRQGSPSGPVVGANSIKVGICLIDWYKLEGNARTPDRAFWDCAAGFQGLSVGWVDQYHHALEGQSVNLTSVPDGDYYLVSTANYAGAFKELDYGNNTAWVRFHLASGSSGNRKVTVLGHSPCDTPGLCGVKAPNR